ncbi:putative Gly-X carboxypeptidase (CPS1) [Bradyrhizobium sp. STM 3843]|uniref:M20 family peptidase n=1 Tax=Bradyrhizobium sp. STM 3843 TaxID=551947 RepID=UPI0002405584|nr:M20 family peptidase [Bradyrhizobium sp. STM 3843]CCE09426.1 putative Gly-X carboxypeptidase (CPS1) [Bradyrhizobium sp. STM 3843]
MGRLLRIVRTITLLAVFAVIVVLAVLTFNTERQGSRQLQVTALPKISIEPQAAAQRLAEAVRFRTISSYDDPEQNADAFAALKAHIETSFPAFHAAAKQEVIAGHSLLYTWPGSDPALKPIALLAHQDVVPIAPGTEADWSEPPFAGHIKDGFIWGRGAWDDKGNLYAMLEAADALAKAGLTPKRTIYFGFGHDEEVGGTRGAKAIAASLAARNVRLDFVLDEGLLISEGGIKGLAKPAALIGVGEKGYATLILTAKATPGHSSMPPHDTAIGMMSAALAKLEADKLPMRIDGVVGEMFATLAPEMSGFNRVALSNLWLFKPLLLREFEKTGPTEAMVRTTTALTIFNAGDKDNVLPGVASATVNFRLLPGDTQASVIDHVTRTIANDHVAIAPVASNTEPPPVTSIASAPYQLMSRTIREIFPDAVVAPGLMIGGTDSRHYVGVADNLFRFSPLRATNEDLKRFHGTNERLSVDGYADMIRFYRRLLEASAS